MIGHLVALVKRSITCFCVSVVLFLFMLGIVAPAYAQSAFDIVDDRIDQDLAAMQTLYENAQDVEGYDGVIHFPSTIVDPGFEGRVRTEFYDPRMGQQHNPMGMWMQVFWHNNS